MLVFSSQQVIHSVPNEFHWPPIFRGSCDNLFCKDPPCFARRKVWRTRCVLVFKRIHGIWVKIGYRLRKYIDHLKCGCKECSDIRDRAWCIRTKPCPNSKDPNSFCRWIPFLYPPILTAEAAAISPAQDDLVIAPIPTIVPTIRPIPGRCECCTPVPCKPPRFFNRNTCRCECPRFRCPRGQIFNSNTCECDCPPGSVKNADGKCVGM